MTEAGGAAPPGETARRFVFLDRDGVVNVYRRGRYVSNPEDLEYPPGGLEAIRRLNENGFEVIVVSNQAGVGKGLMPAENLERITRKLLDDVATAGGRLLDVLYCVHAPSDDCDCRKPKPGLLLEAARRHGVDLPRTFFVGDNRSDVEAAAAAGCRSIFVLAGASSGEDRSSWPVQPEFVVPDLPAAADRVIAGP